MTMHFAVHTCMINELTVMYIACYQQHAYKATEDADAPLPLQLSELYLSGNRLVGTLPESWSFCTSVSAYTGASCHL